MNSPPSVMNCPQSVPYATAGPRSPTERSPAGPPPDRERAARRVPRTAPRIRRRRSAGPASPRIGVFVFPRIVLAPESGEQWRQHGPRRRPGRAVRPGRHRHAYRLGAYRLGDPRRPVCVPCRTTVCSTPVGRPYVMLLPSPARPAPAGATSYTTPCRPTHADGPPVRRCRRRCRPRRRTGSRPRATRSRRPGRELGGRYDMKVPPVTEQPHAHSHN